MNLQECLRLIAQGAINISEGYGTICPNSPVHTAMLELCRHATSGTMGELMAKAAAEPTEAVAADNR